MTILDGRENRTIFLTEDDLLGLLEIACAKNDITYSNHASFRAFLESIIPNLFQGDFSVYVPLNGAKSHCEVESDDGASMIDCNTIVKIDHRIIIVGCDGMLIGLGSGRETGTTLAIRFDFAGTNACSFTFDALDQNIGLTHFAKTLNWQGEHIAPDGLNLLAELWEESEKNSIEWVIAEEGRA